MLEVVKSKSMLGVVILILGVAYFSANPVLHFENDFDSNLIVMAETTK